MAGGGKHQCQVGVLFLIKDEGILGKGFISFSFDAYLIKFTDSVAMLSRLAAITTFGQSTDTCLEYILVAHVCPTVENVILFDFGNINKTVLILIMSFGLVLVMSQEGRTPIMFELEGRVSIGFITARSACE